MIGRHVIVLFRHKHTSSSASGSAFVQLMALVLNYFVTMDTGIVSQPQGKKSHYHNGRLTVVLPLFNEVRDINISRRSRKMFDHCNVVVHVSNAKKLLFVPGFKYLGPDLLVCCLFLVLISMYQNVYWALHLTEDCHVTVGASTGSSFHSVIYTCSRH